MCVANCLTPTKNPEKTRGHQLGGKSILETYKYVTYNSNCAIMFFIIYIFAVFARTKIIRIKTDRLTTTLKAKSPSANRQTGVLLFHEPNYSF